MHLTLKIPTRAPLALGHLNFFEEFFYSEKKQASSKILVSAHKLHKRTKCSLLKKFNPHGRPRDFQVRLFLRSLLMVIKHSRLAAKHRKKTLFNCNSRF
jgi:hypothetical protein